jgi:RasGEF domain/RasGEF N-terminal motif
MTSVLRPDTADSQAHNTFLDMEEESQDEAMHEERNIQPANVEKPETSEPARDEVGSSFDELIDRLLALPMSKQDGKFVPVFLCLYRKFASPSQVFSAITNRFGRVEHSNDAQLTKVGEQLRYLQVLALWTGDYPGDFAQASIKKDALAFVAKLERSRVFAYAAKEIANHLELAREDEDADWGRFDGLDALNEAEESFHSQSEATSPSIRTGQSSTEELLKSSKQSSSEGSYEDLTRMSGAPSVESSLVRSSNMSSLSLAAFLTRDEIRQEAQTLICVPRMRLSKLQWHQFVETPDDEIAKELTRMDWILYSSIRPRDLVRHVTLANDGKKAAGSLENVDRMIEHFNHLFCFVSGMILLRDKPKHRARMLGKWMTVAWKVRQLNNYNTLGSIIAGTNGTAVHRLTCTWELVPDQIRKEYMRLTILMGTVRSHGAYRMAWENSFSERIPFVPVYRKDLVAAETGNRTNVGPQGDRINWKKFEIMGEVIISMQKSQDKPYKLRRNEDVMRLVLETQISQGDEVCCQKGGFPVILPLISLKDLAEELYERSLQVEPSTGSGESRRRLDWLRR